MKELLFWFLLLPQAASAQALLAGSEYYDSFDTLAAVVIMKAANNQAGRDFLEKEGRILPKSNDSLPIIIIARGQEPQSGCEFRFPAFPHTYWTFSENVATIEELKGEAASPSPSPESRPAPAASVALPQPTPTPEPTAAAEASPSKKKKPKKQTAEHGAIEWHLVNGQWKWRPLDRSQFKGWQSGASAPDGSRGPR